MPFVIDRECGEEIQQKLKCYDEVLIKSYKCERVGSSLATHPDLQIHKVCGDRAYAEPSTFEYYKNALSDYMEILQGNSIIGSTYKTHVAYNIARVGKNVFCNLKYADLSVLEYYKKNGFNLVHINQGYAKCNMCIISDNAVITEDKGIASVLEKNGVSYCLINTGFVRLKGFEYGFIGGASGSDDNNIFFCGDIERHPEYEKIFNFVKENSDKKIVSLKLGELCDFGSIINMSIS